ncbi:MAG: carboxypeptidase-like regulatory domain-containing protein, partial [Candidatus Binatia bacterium]
MGFSAIRKGLISPVIFMIGALSSIAVFSGGMHAGVVVDRATNLGVIRGVVRDDGGSPIADATVAIFRAGTVRLLKQVRSADDGSFFAKILPGTYSVLAVAQGFNPVTIAAVEVNKADDLVYRFKLERAGSGNTLPENRPDRY